MIINFHGEAHADIFKALIRLEQRANGRGLRFRTYCHRWISMLSTFPQLGGRVRRSVPGREVRLLILKKYRYLVHYEVTAQEIIILSVTDGRRRGHPWRQRL